MAVVFRPSEILRRLRGDTAVTKDVHGQQQNRWLLPVEMERVPIDASVDPLEAGDIQHGMHAF
ncbi:hypothetical protein WN943_004493 [Citrus x changshan-huyou]